MGRVKKTAGRRQKAGGRIRAARASRPTPNTQHTSPFSSVWAVIDDERFHLIKGYDNAFAIARETHGVVTTVAAAQRAAF